MYSLAQPRDRFRVGEPYRGVCRDGGSEPPGKPWSLWVARPLLGLQECERLGHPKRPTIAPGRQTATPQPPGHRFSAALVELECGASLEVWRENAVGREPCPRGRTK